jgi:uncharacterized protein (DUF924 family)
LRRAPLSSTRPTGSTPEAILAYWFADALESPAKAQARMPFWFESNAETDREIAQRFSSTLEAAAAGGPDEWEGRSRACLALVIALDQFPRNIHRSTAAAFAHDAQALAVARRGIASGYLRELATLEQAFLLMPFQHCEDLACQREGVAHFRRMVEEAPPQWREVAAGMLDYAERHLAIIERFGRFPHRNAILGRPSTAAEAEYLESNSESFGQGG